MNFLGELTEKEVGVSKPEVTCDNLKLRRTVRAVAFNDKGLIPIIYFETDKYHILPGGSTDKDEGLADALRREFHEEVGFDVKVTGEVGVIVTQEFSEGTLQINYCYLGTVGNETGKVVYTDEEKVLRPVLKWVSLDRAIELLKSDRPIGNIGLFNSARDLQFCLEAQKLI
jgi:ADP-ribose pyrophosphatase YjhB (NUDIX family)